MVFLSSTIFTYLLVLCWQLCCPSKFCKTFAPANSRRTVQYKLLGIYEFTRQCINHMRNLWTFFTPSKFHSLNLNSLSFKNREKNPTKTKNKTKFSAHSWHSLLRGWNSLSHLFMSMYMYYKQFYQTSFKAFTMSIIHLDWLLSETTTWTDKLLLLLYRSTLVSAQEKQRNRVFALARWTTQRTSNPSYLKYVPLITKQYE